MKRGFRNWSQLRPVEAMDHVQGLRESAKGRPKFVLHEAPYANGHLHIGHALN